MVDKKVTAHGREFTFDEGTSEAEQQARIRNWMQLHAPGELSSVAAAAENRPPAPAPDALAARPNYNPILGKTAATFLRAAPGLGAFADTEAVQKRIGDPDFYRTVAQGVGIPISDEIIAKTRSVLPGGPTYDVALADERQRLKDYGERVGEFEKTITELGGAALTIPLTAGAGAVVQGARAVPYLGAGLNALGKYSGGAKLAQLAAKYPWMASVVGGAGSGAAAGFAAGEGDFDKRADSALTGAGFGAVLGPLGRGAIRGLEHGTDIFSKNNKVADFLRKRLVQDRGQQYKADPTMGRTATGDIDVNHPDFARKSAAELDAALKREQNLSNRKTDVMTGDVMPETVESVLLHPGENNAQLRRQIVQRQYNPNLPEDAAEQASQFGHVGKWFDRVFGKDVFRRTDDQLEQHLRDEANRNFAPAYARNIRSPELDDALNDPFVKKAWKDAVDKMDSERKPIGVINSIAADGQPNISQYNTEFLHKLKRTMDDMAEAARSRPEGTTGKDTARIIGSAKERLNKAIMDANPDYAHAMKQFGEEADVLAALRKGRTEVFGPSPDQIDKGIGAEDIIAALNNPAWTDAQREMYRMGASRALRANLLGSESKKFTHNWADTLANPNLAKKYKALVDPSERHLWDNMRDQLLQLSGRRHNLERALGNSKTASRKQLVEELETPSHLADIVATGMNPSAPSVGRSWMRTFLDPKGGSKSVTNEVSKLLSGYGPEGNRKNVEQIYKILSDYQGRNEAFSNLKSAAPIFTPLLWPGKND